MNEDRKEDQTLAAAQHATLSGQDVQITMSDMESARASYREMMMQADDNLMREMVDRQMAPTLQDIEDITVKYTRAQIAGNPKDFSVEVLVVELRAIAGQQVQIGTTNKLRTHFDKISGELRRRGLDNNGEPLDG